MTILLGCKPKSKAPELITNPTEQIPDSVLDNILSKEYSLFAEENPLNKYGQVYLINFKLKNKDTLIQISKTYKPVIIDGVTDLEFKGGYYDTSGNPVIILDNKNSLGTKFYKSSMLNSEILHKFDSIEQPSNVSREIKSKTYVVNDKGIIVKDN